MVQSRAAWADETQVCWPKQSSALWKGTWTQQGTEMSPGVQEKLHGDGARKTCLASELNNWASKQKLKGVSSPNFPSFHKFPFLGGITKQTKTTQKTNRKTTSQLEMWPPRQSGPRKLTVPAPWNEQSLPEGTLSSSLVCSSTADTQQNGHHSTQTGAAKLHLKRRPREVSSWAADDSFPALGRSDLGLSASHHTSLSSGGLHTFRCCFSGLTASEITINVTGLMDSSKDRVMGAPFPWADAIQAVSVPAASSAPEHLTPYQYEPSCFPSWCENDGEARFRNRSCWKHTFFFFLGGRGNIIFDLNSFPGLAQSTTTQCLCQHKEAI